MACILYYQEKGDRTGEYLVVVDEDFNEDVVDGYLKRGYVFRSHIDIDEIPVEWAVGCTMMKLTSSPRA